MLQRKKWTCCCCYWGVDKLFTMTTSCHQQQNHFFYVIPYYQTEVSGVSPNSWLANQSINLTKWAVLNITIFFNPSSRGEFVNVCTENAKKELVYKLNKWPVKNTFLSHVTSSTLGMQNVKTSNCQSTARRIALIRSEILTHALFLMGCHDILYQYDFSLRLKRNNFGGTLII